MMKKMKTIALSKIKQNTAIGISDVVANPGSHCPMHTALSTIMQFEGLSSLVVGMGECGYYSRYVTEYNWGHSFLKDQKHSVKTAHYVYEMDSNEVVFGCREGLIKALHEIDQEGISALIIIGTCIPALIGEDMESLIEEVMAEKSTQCKIGYVDAAHFKYNGYGSGFYKIYEQLGKLYVDKSANKTILFLGEGQGEEYGRLKQQLEQNGYQIRIFKNGLAFEEWTSLFDGIGVLVFQELRNALGFDN
jgi:nitrogenase molybdenum-iron protein alpha/beta subunit